LGTNTWFCAKKYAGCAAMNAGCTSTIIASNVPKHAMSVLKPAMHIISL
jgi:hypothetical protein